MSPEASPHWVERVRDAVAAFERVLDDTFPLLTSKPDRSLVPRQLAAGGLARCRALLHAMRILETERPDVMGLFQRNAWETVTVALYVLLGGDEALEVVLGDHTRHVGLIVERNDLNDLVEVIKDWPTSATKLNIENIAQKLGPLLQAAGDENANASTGYDLLYRAESTFGGHGLGTMSRYTDLKTSPWRVITEPGPLTVRYPTAYLGLTALHTAILASHIFEAFGVGTNELDQCCEAVLNAMNAEPDCDL